MTVNVDKLEQTEQSSVFKSEINKIRAANIIFAISNENRRLSCAVIKYLKLISIFLIKVKTRVILSRLFDPSEKGQILNFTLRQARLTKVLNVSWR